MSESSSRVTEIAGLTEAVSAQARVANRSWIALVVVASVTLVQTPPAQNSVVPLPFNLGEVASDSYYPYAFLLLAILVIGFCVAHGQEMRATNIVHTRLGTLAGTSHGADEVHPRDLFDILRHPSINRVAPLAQLFLGTGSFRGAAHTPSTWRRLLAVVSYVLLKVVSAGIYLVLPSVALLSCYCRAAQATDVHWTFKIVGLLASLLLLQAIALEVWYSARIIPKLWKVDAIA